MEPRITLVTLGVEDLERSLVFYRDGLGLPVEQALPEVVFFRLGALRLGLFGRAALAADAGVEDDGSGFRPITLAHNERSPEAVDRVFAEAEAAGARIVKRPHATDWGGYSGYFADPDGHLWEVAHNPAWDIDEA
jgi:catechol 2,3-dioxygenase-like lactoylglutathione lyase family enzyme